ncbi:hypothetical protein [Embleya sp. NPDC005575]|uniref:hypothetical protein n=1 Tax=Embleya sp. NPDC005575 TaxID=3156892 RepID=UPI0033BD7055
MSDTRRRRRAARLENSGHVTSDVEIPATDRPAAPAGRRRFRAFANAIVERPYLITAGLIGLIIVTGVNGPDWPAQYFRTWLIRDHGTYLWNNQWYGGHLLPGYSILAPVIASKIGTATLTALSCVTSAWAWDKLRVGGNDFARRVGSCWFAVMCSVDYLIGRTPFALGVAAGMLAILAARRRHPLWAGFAALLCGLSSPLSGAFLMLVALAWVPKERVWPTRLCFAPAALGLVAALAFPNEGMFPFPWWRFLPILAFAAVGLLILPKEQQSARRFLWLYAATAVIFFFVPTSLGGNLARLGELTAGPLMAVVLLSAGRRRLVVLLTLPLLVWQFQSAALAITHDIKDSPGEKPQYYAGMLDFLQKNNTHPLGRVEIPFTRGHWESVFVAEKMPLARGWERQLDRNYNAVLYQEDLTIQEYRDWIDNTGVRFVALPDIPIDPSAIPEADLIRKGIPWLKPVYADKDGHWQIWEVEKPTPIVMGPGELTELTPSRFSFDARSAGTFVIKIHPTFWVTPDRPGIVIKATEDEWSEITVDRPGPVTVSARDAKLFKGKNG